MCQQERGDSAGCRPSVPGVPEATVGAWRPPDQLPCEDMARLLLETKLHVPGRRRGLVARPRLNARLSSGAQARLTLVSAPAGFGGETTLLAGWLSDAEAGGRSVAWVSLDRSDNDLVLFWSYVVVALNKTLDGVGRHLFSHRCGRPSRRFTRCSPLC